MIAISVGVAPDQSYHVLRDGIEALAREVAADRQISFADRAAYGLYLQDLLEDQ